jgi:hypothetical protein
VPPLAGAGVAFDGFRPTPVAVPNQPWMSTGPLTLGVWFRARAPRVAGTEQAIVAHYDNVGGPTGWRLYITSAGLLAARSVQWGQGGDSQPQGSGAVTDGVWRRALLVIEVGQPLRIYLDGVLHASAGSVGAFANAGALWLGDYPTGTSAPLNGSTQGLRAWQRALTAAEVLRDFTHGDVTRGLVLDLPLDEGVGVKALDRAPKTVGLQMAGVNGDVATTPHSPDLDVTGDLELVARIAPTVVAPPATARIISKRYTTGVSANYALFLSAAAQPNLDLGALGTVNASAAIAAGFLGWLKATRRASDGRVQFWTAPDSEQEPTTGWVQLGTDRASTAGALTANTDALTVGGIGVQATPFSGTIYRAIVRRGIGSTVAVFDWDATQQAEAARTTREQAKGATVTLQGNASLTFPRHDGTLTGGATWVQPKADRGMRGNGAANGVAGGSVDTTAPAGIATQRQITGMAWVKYENPQALYQTFMALATGNQFMLRFDRPDHVVPGFEGNVGGYIAGAAGANIPTLDDGRWHHVTYVLDVDQPTAMLRVLVDGVVVAAFAGAGITPANFTGWNIGASPTLYARGPDARAWRGGMRDGAMFTRALSQAEVRQVMLGLVKPTDLPGCVAWFPLERDTLNRAAKGTQRVNRLARAGVAIDGLSLTGWLGEGGWTATTDAALGAMVVTATGVPAAGVNGVVANASGGPTRAPVTPGEVVTISCDVAAPNPVTGVHITGDLYTALTGGSHLGGLTSPSVTAGPHGWQRVTVTGVVYPTGVGMRVNVRATNAVTGQVFYVRNITVRGGTSSAHAPATELELAPAAHGREVNAPRLVQPRARGGVLAQPVGAAGEPRISTGYVVPGTVFTWATDVLWNPSAGGIDPYSGIMGNFDGSNRGAALRLFLGSRNVGFSTNGATVTANFGPGWVSVAAVSDGVSHHLYLNGLLALSAAGVPLPAVSPLELLRHYPQGVSDAYNGRGVRMANARVWTRALSADEVAGLVLGDVPRHGLEGEWLTEGSLQGAVALDTSGKGRHGTIVGAVAA